MVAHGIRHRPSSRVEQESLSLYRWEFRLTLNVIARILREVVNRVKLGNHYTRRRSRGEVQSRVVRRRVVEVRRLGEGGDLCCICVVL